MPFDGVVINSLTKEIKNNIVGNKIEKIYQPEADEIVLRLRNKEKLAISVNSSCPRFYLTKENKDNPVKPPMFCMLLRKHIQGGVIRNIEQIELERIVKISVEGFDELGDPVIKEIIIEIMGKHSNIILVDKKAGKIIDSIKRVPESVSRMRQVLPGLEYCLPPQKDKLNLLLIDFVLFKDKLTSAKEELPVYKAIYQSFQGVSPVLAKEICYRATLADDTLIRNLRDAMIKPLWNSVVAIFDELFNKKSSPVIIKESGRWKDFYAIELSMYDNELFKQLEYDSVSDIIDVFYRERDLANRIKQKSSDISKVIQIRLDRVLHKLSKQKEELLTAEGADKYKLYGELLLSNLNKIEQGMSEITVQNYYDPELKDITIPLSIRLTPNENSQRYYKRYNKYKNAILKIKDQIKDAEAELHYLEHVLTSIENTEEYSNIEDIRQELVEEGYLKPRNRKVSSKNKGKNKGKKQKVTPPRYVTKDGTEIYLGKNNKQNDYLTLKLSSKKDLWFHTKEIPGSHVIIRTKGQEAKEEDIRLAATLAAYNSKAKLSSNVPVDYTIVKNVKKPKGAKPGMVIYDDYNTIYVTPDKDVLEEGLTLEANE